MKTGVMKEIALATFSGLTWFTGVLPKAVFTETTSTNVSKLIIRASVEKLTALIQLMW